MEISSEVLNTVAQVLQEKFGFATQTQLDKAVADLIKRTAARQEKGPSFSISTMIRGLRALKGEALNAGSAEADVGYLKALGTGTAPGSYLVPTGQADEIISYLTIGGVARSMGVRIWPMNGLDKLNVPAATGVPTWEWLGQSTAQAASDPALGQMPFSLKTRRCLIVIPNELLATSVPQFDTVISELIGSGAAEHEDTAFFGTTSAAGGPTALYAASNISTVNAGGGSANGGNITFQDVLAVLAKSFSVKAKGPFVWAMSGRSFFNRILGLVDLQSRPLCIPTATQGLAGAANYNLMGYPVFLTPAISETEAVGSGTNQSHLIFTNPRYCHIAQDDNIAIGVSSERYFAENQTAIRAVQREDMGYTPAAGVVVLRGVN